MSKLKKDSPKEQILNSALTGVEFEFYSKLSLKDTQESLKKLLNREIQLEDKAHSDFQPSDKVFKMEPDMSGGKGLIELVTGAMPYRNARMVIIRMLKWIQENGYTNERSSIHLNLSFDKQFLEDPNMISKMNVLKFILEFNEDQVYKIFPNRKDSVYAKTIKWVVPRDEAYSYDENNTSQHNFIFPNTKYYGINFDKKVKNYLEFRYLGGKDYENKLDDILYLLERFIIQLWNSCQDSNFTILNKLELKRILNNTKSIVDGYRDYKSIPKNWKDITIMVDLQEHEQIIKIHWDRIKERVMDLFSEGGLKSGIVNYDSDTGKIQVKDGKFSAAYLIQDVELIDCEINGNITNCDMYGSKIKDGIVTRSNLYLSTEVRDCKVESSYVHGSCNIYNSYVYGRDGVFKGKMVGGIFREGNIGDSARFEETEVVVSKKIQNSSR